MVFLDLPVILVELLENVRKLKSLGIKTQFLTANMSSSGNSEFVLTISVTDLTI